ncbi:hypothetical protein FOG50_02998 [Hanseniaspora uvarum]|nr:hypothetical protein FOG50_02998 [Hanseniaspora uvarum]
MFDPNTKKQYKLLLKLFVHLFDKIVNGVDAVHNLNKYGIITEKSRIYRLFMTNKTLLKIWVISRFLDLIESIKSISKLNLIYKEYKATANKLKKKNLIAKDKEELIQKKLYQLEANIKQWKIKYVSAIWDLVESLLTLALSILKIWKKININNVRKIEKLIQSLGYMRLSYDIYNMGSMMKDVYSVIKTRRA